MVLDQDFSGSLFRQEQSVVLNEVSIQDVRADLVTDPHRLGSTDLVDGSSFGRGYKLIVITSQLLVSGVVQVDHEGLPVVDQVEVASTSGKLHFLDWTGVVGDGKGSVLRVSLHPLYLFGLGKEVESRVADGSGVRTTGGYGLYLADDGLLLLIRAYCVYNEVKHVLFLDLRSGDEADHS